jgi:hypothetical protein
MITLYKTYNNFQDIHLNKNKSGNENIRNIISSYSGNMKLDKIMNAKSLEGLK